MASHAKRMNEPGTTTPPTLRPRVLHESGGLAWHWRAWRNRRRWQPFRNTLAAWLDGWRPQRTELVLIGPSAGHTLPVGSFARFSRITILEPDPLARWLLRRRLAGLPLVFDSLDAFADGGFARLAQAYPRHALLFCNVLGQLAPRDEAAAARWCKALRTALAGHAWASWHDLISTTRPPRRTAAHATDGPLTLEALLARFWDGGELPLVDHGTLALAPDLPHGHAVWPITPRYWHLVEWCVHTPGAEVL